MTAACAVLFPALVRPASLSGAEEGAAAEDLVACPRCGAAGKIDCPECGGRGEIYRPCDICGGKGEKPCPVCSKYSKGGSEAGAVSVQPGLVPCGYCGGKGTVAGGARTCTRCGGVGANTCLACGGKGTVACRKEVFVRVCPTCRFARTIPCPLCDGATLVPRSLAASKRSAAPSRKAGPEGNGDSTQAGRATANGGEGESAAPKAALTIDEIRARYEALVPVCEAHHDVFVEDLTPNAENVRGAALKLKKALEAAGAGSDDPMLKEISAVVDRCDSFRRRWQRLRELYEEEARSYGAIRDNWALREETLASTASKVIRAEREADWERRMKILLKILEKNVAPLQADDPSWILEEVTSLERGISALDKKVAGRVAELAAEAAAKAREAKTQAAGGPRSTPVPGAASASSPKRDAAAKGAPTRPGSGQDRQGRTPEARPAPSAAKAAPSVAEVRSRAGRPRRDDAKTTKDEGGSGGLGWAVAGFLAACGLFLVVSRLRARRAGGPRDGDPPSRDGTAGSPDRSFEGSRGRPAGRGEIETGYY